ncbi:hypothetical protein [Legionella sp. km772]|uniref:hypothetical protein n=1 Tax=Legionella sp. km772 TaxID=2498111 RepID=UPI000F8E338D|nr:hypothetical protein [Legionella sp. km772]RUR10265.1 hypothetical protein ELY15_08280 [Legionella sp. km772]
MDQLITIAKTVSEKFILGENAFANVELAKLSKLVIEQTTLHQNNEISLLMNKIIKAHEDKNYLFIADILVYELIPALLRA